MVAPRTHWADWSIRQEGSTPVIIHQVVAVEVAVETLAEVVDLSARCRAPSTHPPKATSFGTG